MATSNPGNSSNCLVVLSSSGTNPLGIVRLTDPRAVRVEYDKSLHGNIIHLSGDPTTTKLQLPREDRPVYALQLTHPYVAVQVFVPTCSSNLIEFVLGDGPTNRLRLCFALPRNVWSIILFDVEKLAKYYLKISTFRSVDAIVLGGEMRLRKIISLKDPLPDQYTPWNGILPRDVELPPGTAYTVVAFSPPAAKAAQPPPPPMPTVPDAPPITQTPTEILTNPPANSSPGTEGLKGKPPAGTSANHAFRLPPSNVNNLSELGAIGTQLGIPPPSSSLVPDRNQTLSFSRTQHGQIVVSTKPPVQPQIGESPSKNDSAEARAQASLRFLASQQEDNYVRLFSEETANATNTNSMRKPSSIRRKPAPKEVQPVMSADPSDWLDDETPSGWGEDMGGMASTMFNMTMGPKKPEPSVVADHPADNYTPRAPARRQAGWMPYEPVTHTDSEEEE